MRNILRRSKFHFFHPFRTFRYSKTVRSMLIRILLVCTVLLSCHKKEISGWNYNDPSNGGFQKVPYYNQETPPGMVLVEGGTFLFKNENGTEKKSVNHFFISKTEETNRQ